MSGQGRSLVPQDEGENLSSAISTLHEFRTKDLEGYVALGAYFCEIIESGKHPQVEAEFSELGEFKKSNLQRLAKHLVYDGTKSKIKREIDLRKEDLWTEACYSGISGLISEFQAGNQENVQSINESIFIRTSFLSQVKAGVVATFIFSVLLLILNQLDNPLSQTIDMFLSSEQNEGSVESFEPEGAARALSQPSPADP